MTRSVRTATLLLALTCALPFGCATTQSGSQPAVTESGQLQFNRITRMNSILDLFIAELTGAAGQQIASEAQFNRLVTENKQQAGTLWAAVQNSSKKEQLAAAEATAYEIYVALRNEASAAQIPAQLTWVQRIIRGGRNLSFDEPEKLPTVTEIKAWGLVLQLDRYKEAGADPRILHYELESLLGKPTAASVMELTGHGIESQAPVE